MAEGTYEYECMRAELLGIEKPNQAEFEKARAERLEREQQEQEAAEAALLEEQEAALKGAGGKLDELNSILSSTQQKLNRFKQTACGSFSHIFSKGTSMDAPDMSATTSAAASRKCSDAAAANADEMDNALNKLDDLQGNATTVDGPVISTEKIRNAKLDIQRKMTAQMDKLDSLIHKAQNAEVSMSEQSKQMRKEITK